MPYPKICQENNVPYIHEFNSVSPDGNTHNQIGDSIQVYLMSDLSGEQTVILITICWWQKLGRDWQ
jgi:hypothetical protein